MENTDVVDDDTTIAITGMACRFPGADSAEEYWHLLSTGAEPLERVPDAELADAGLLESASTDPFYVPWRKPFGDPALFDPSYFGMTPAEAAVTDPQQRMLLETAVHALEDAGLAPEQFPGRIGVFLGLNHSDYLLQNVLNHPEVVDRLGWHRVLMGNDRGYTATTLSYRLGLTGPSVAVDCACSSSLAAVHQACRSLLDLEADAVLVGGASVKPRDLGYRYSEGGIGSPDGRCRPFSADARGTVFASGVGLVVLRRLRDALADGDRVLAVITASDMNNDGARKSGYTAPSQEGQAELIASVHDLAGVTADKISYVEAHGTGTVLGDPIEVSALTQAFRATTDRTGFCAISSAKATIGHLDSASGIAGLIKVVLALRHRVLPPTPGCERLNPHIDFASSPFRVLSEPEPWRTAEPRMAGVSSFGVGGTNVHVLLQEHIPADKPADEPAPGAVLLPFTARSEGARAEMTARLAGWAATATGAETADAAHELFRRRSRHPLRGALLRQESGQVSVLDPGPGDPALAERRPAFVLRAPGIDTASLNALLDQQSALRRTAESLVGPLAAVRRTSPRRLLELLDQEHAVVSRTVTGLACAALWSELGVEPAAVLADQDSRLAAAVLCGTLDFEAAAAVLAKTGEGVEPFTAFASAPRGRTQLPWYDACGSELCAPGELPAAECGPGGQPAQAGFRTIPPRVSALLEIHPAPGPRTTPAGFVGTPLLTAPAGTAAGPASLLASVGLAWALGLQLDIGALVTERRERVESLPKYPFQRRRHWLTAQLPSGGSRRARPEPETAGTDILEGTRALFAEALGEADVAPDDDIFSRGGDSLLATRVVALAQARWGRRVPLGTFLRQPTPAGLAAILRDTAAETDDSSSAGAAEQPSAFVPVTPLQERFLYLSELDGAAESYNVPVLADLRGPLDIGALRSAFTSVVARHESLRVSFHHTEEGFVQKIAPHLDAELPLVQVTEERLRDSVTELLDVRIPLDAPPLFRGAVFRLGPERHVLALAIHHIVADARSTGLLLADLYAYYEEFTTDRPASLVSLDGQLSRYGRAYSDWLRSRDAKQQLDYWLKELDGLPEPLALPADRPRRPRRSYRGARFEFAMSPEVSERVRRLAAEHHTTAFSVVLTAFGCWLSRVANQQKLVIGTPVSGRHRADNQHLIGNFVNTLPLVTDVDETLTFAELLKRTVEKLTGALDNQDIPFEVTARELNRDHQAAESVFQVLFNMLSAQASVPPSPVGLTVAPLPFDRTTSPYELSLDWWFSTQGHLAGRLQYDTDRFDRDTVAGWYTGFEFLLDTFTSAPQKPFLEIPSTPPAAGERLRAMLTGPVVEVSAKPVHAVFAEQAERHPHRLAVTDGADSVTYQELARITAELADRIASRGVGPGDTVGIALPRSTALVAALLAVLRAGATPVPFDLSLPDRRLTLMAEDARIRLVFSTGPDEVPFATGVPVLDMQSLHETAGREGPAVGDTCPGDTGAYITYTSGTTGQPKGIVFTHRGLANLVHWETEGYTRARRWLQFASFGFDAAFHETFSALCTGGSLHIVGDDDRHDHDALTDFLREHRVEKAIFPVSVLLALASRFADDSRAFTSLTEIASTGEQLRISEALVTFFSKLPQCVLINNYGPAETHVVTSYRFGQDPAEWPRHAPIGSPIQNVSLAILGHHGQEVPQGSMGELLISGVCVAAGYLYKPALTAERFGTTSLGDPSYRSGDMVRLLRSGVVEFTERRDQQVKIRGHRVELGEIEVCIRQEPGVGNVALTVRGAEGDRRIDAYLVARDTAVDIVTRVRERLRENLPAALVPSSFTLLDRLPVNANGKVETSRLPEPGAATAAAPVGRGGTDPDRGDGPAGTLEIVLGLFRSVLDLSEVGPDDDFFELGGYSLAATRLIHGLRERLGFSLRMSELHEASTPSRLAELADRGSARPGRGAPSVLPPAPATVALTPGMRALAEDSTAQKTFVFDVGRRLDKERLRAAVRGLTARHAALRLRVAEGIAERVASEPEIVELSCPEDLPSAEAAAWLHERMQRTPVDGGSGSLVRVATTDRPGNRTLLVITVHLLALDGTGLVTICQDLSRFYDSPSADPAEDDGFIRYLAWRSALSGGEELETATTDWRADLQGRPDPENFFVAGGQESSGNRRVWAPASALHAGVRARCAEMRVTPFFFHLTAFATALSLVTGTERPCVSVALDGRPDATLEGTVGHFANLVPLPLLIPRHAELGKLVQQVQADCQTGLDRRHLPFGELAANDPDLSRHLANPVVFTYSHDDGKDIEIDGAPMRPIGPDPLPAGQRLGFGVTDDGSRFSAMARCRTDSPGLSGGTVMGLYRQALYGLAFEQEGTVQTLYAKTPGGIPAEASWERS